MPPIALLSFLDLALEIERFFFRHTLGAVVGDDLFHFLQAFDRNLDRLEVGQHAAEPPLIDIRHAGALCFLDNRVACLALGADEQDRAAVARKLPHKSGRCLKLIERALEIDDVNLVAVAENERRHFRIPEARLMSEMNTGFQHLTHCYRHVWFSKVSPCAGTEAGWSFWSLPAPWWCCA